MASRHADERQHSDRGLVIGPPPFLPMLQKHLLEHTAEGPNGLLFPGDRTDHMSVRYRMDRYRPAREVNTLRNGRAEYGKADSLPQWGKN